jgi:lysophospholipase L1-like esterase
VRVNFRGSLLIPFALALVGVACGGGGSPTGATPQPTPTPGTPVSGFVFYDENGNGVLDAGEDVRLPGVTVMIGGQAAVSTAGGQFTVKSVPSGAQTAQARADSLPAYFLPGAPVGVQVPQVSGFLAVPAVLPIGTNRANRYMAFGDSISAGEGSSDGAGYRSWLEAGLDAYWGGRAETRDEGQPATRSDAGAGRIGGVLAQVRPAYTLILYGTNDWNELECKDDFPCFTIDSLRSMIQQTKDANSVPVIATIIPVNTAYADKSPPERQDWVKNMNDLIRPLAKQEGAILADLFAVMFKQPDLASLFTDHIHPNDRGYAIMGQEWTRAITAAGGASTAAASRVPVDLDAVFTGPGGGAGSGVSPGRAPALPGRRR